MINILMFSPSSRMIWMDRRALNPMYLLMTNLVVMLTRNRHYRVYSIRESFLPANGVREYRKGVRVDCVISIGAMYYTSNINKKVVFDRAYSRHKRVFKIGQVINNVWEENNPLHINLCADVNKWPEGLSEVFGKKPDIYITEQEMEWTRFLYYYCKNSYKKYRNCINRQKRFFFAGGAKNRQKKMIRLTKRIDVEKIIAGGGWENVLVESNGYKLLGYIKFLECLKYYLESLWSVVLHTDIGNAYGWITGRLFMNIGCGVVGFVEREYDCNYMYVPEKSILRVDSDIEINSKIEKIGYEQLIKEQEKIVRNEWLDIDKCYINPFIKKISGILI